MYTQYYGRRKESEQTLQLRPLKHGSTEELVSFCGNKNERCIEKLDMARKLEEIEIRKGKSL